MGDSSISLLQQERERKRDCELVWIGVLRHHLLWVSWSGVDPLLIVEHTSQHACLFVYLSSFCLCVCPHRCVGSGNLITITAAHRTAQKETEKVKENQIPITAGVLFSWAWSLPSSAFESRM